MQSVYHADCHDRHVVLVLQLVLQITKRLFETNMESLADQCGVILFLVILILVQVGPFVWLIPRG